MAHRIPGHVSHPLQNFYIAQLSVWSTARENYAALSSVKKRDIAVADFKSAVQFNPGRVRSTKAATDAASVEKRPCFLCDCNRPKEQIAESLNSEFDILVNPYPIFPLHLTISSTTHRPQSQWPLDMVTFIESMRGLCAFYNGASAGASAPDHLHFQACADCELPLIQLVEQEHSSDNPGLMLSTDFSGNIPFGFWSFVIEPTPVGMQMLNLAQKAKGYRKSGYNQRLTRESFDESLATADLLNSLVWIDAMGKLRIVIIPRTAHRPSHYYREDDLHRTVSPGAVDMAGLIIVPDEKTFDSLSAREVEEIYNEVALSPDEFSSVQSLLLK